MQVRVTKERGGVFMLSVRHKREHALKGRWARGLTMEEVKNACAEEARKFDEASGRVPQE